MKRYWMPSIVCFALLFCYVLSNSNCTTEEAVAQTYSTKYFWSDSIAVTTSSQDSVWYSQNSMWQQATFWFDGTAGYFKAASPDTGSMSSRYWTYLREHEAYTIGPATKLRRLQFKGVGSGTFYISGYKNTAQF